MSGFDENLGRKLQQQYMSPSVVARRRAALDLLGLHSGQVGLDIGTGPGFLACGLAERVGSAGQVMGIDTSVAMLDFACHRAKQMGVAKWTEFREADATALPIPDASFDGAVAIQVFEFVPDIEQAVLEAHRVLRPGGRLIVIDSDWATLVWNTEDDALMTRMRQALLHAGHFAHPTLPRRFSHLLQRAGFDEIVVTPSLIFETKFDADAYSYYLLEIATNLACGHLDFTSLDADAFIVDVKNQVADGEYWFSLNQYMFMANKRA